MFPQYQTDLHDPLCDATPLTPQSAARLLQQIVDNASGKTVIFDLDSTLLNNRPRNARIMQEYAQQHSVQNLANATAEHFPNWDTRNSLSLLGLTEQEIANNIRAYEQFWAQRFFTSEYCQYDIAVPGAVAFVQRLSQQCAQVLYLTGRDETMRPGTAESLASLGFPEPHGHAVQLKMKPSRDDPDDTFKRNAVDNLKAGASVYAAFDNEPTHINTYRQELPAATCVHLFTDHSMRRVNLLEGIFSITDFNH